MYLNLGQNLSSFYEVKTKENFIKYYKSCINNIEIIFNLMLDINCEYLNEINRTIKNKYKEEIKCFSKDILNFKTEEMFEDNNFNNDEITSGFEFDLSDIDQSYDEDLDSKYNFDLSSSAKPDNSKLQTEKNENKEVDVPLVLKENL